jgi:DNA helicase-2/ATP-dependent DNA helicase PcrA
VEIRDVIDASTRAGNPGGVVDNWAPAPAEGEPNPLCDNITEVLWPVDPLHSRTDIERGAALVTAAMATRSRNSTADPDGWIADVDALLAERARAHQPRPVTLPAQLSVSALVDLDRDPEAAARRLTRRLPARPDAHAILGTAFHDWVQRFFGADRLFDLDDLPGAGDPRTADATELTALQDAFTASAWATRTPVDVEVGFEMVIADTVVRGRIDAVFADPDGGVTVVDWKTGEPPADDAARRHAAVQLAVYRLAWAGLTGRPESEVRAAFHYVRSGRTVTPDSLLGAEELAALLTPAGERCA